MPLVARATTRVETRVNTEAVSGEQSVGDEQTNTGNQLIEVNVETIVNGQTIKPVNLKRTNEGGSTTVMIEQSTIAASGSTPASQIEVTVDGQPVLTESQQTLNQNFQPEITTPSLIESLTDWMKEIWHKIIKLFS